MLTAQQREIVVQVMTRVGVVPGVGDTLDEIIDNATFDDRLLTAKNNMALRKGLRKLGIQSPPKGPKRPGYREAVEYLALNDDDEVISAGGPTVCVSMVAHLFNRPDREVIEDVLDYRRKHV